MRFRRKTDEILFLRVAVYLLLSEFISDALEDYFLGFTCAAMFFVLGYVYKELLSDRSDLSL